MQAIVEEQVVTGDRVVTRALWCGTHTSPYSGVAPTGKRVEVRDISIWRFVDGGSAENWTVLDQFTLLQQIGVIHRTIGDFEVPAPPSGVAQEE